MALLGTAFLGGVAAAQQPQGQQQLEEVVVTGSRIVRRDFEANSPITTIDQSLIENTMSVGIEKVLNQLPQFVPAVSQFVTTDVQSTATNSPGSSTLSLRGLGSNRNLVLIDGRRAMPVNATMAIDINTIPSAMIDRVETITGGASSTYGADAMAGVVNFILKKNFEGVDFDTRYGTTMDGGGDELRLTGLFGSNFADSKGNVMMGFEYDSRGKVLQADRSFYRNGWADPNTGSSFFGHAEPFFQAQAGNLPTQATVDAAFPGHTVANINTGQQFYWNYDDNSLYKRTADGTYNYHGPLVVDGLQYREIRTDTSPGASAAGTLVQNEIQGLASIPFTRYAAFGRAHLNLTDHLEAVVQANFSEDETRTMLGDNWALSFWAAPIPHGDRIYAPSFDTTTGNTFPDYLPGGARGLNCPTTGGCTVSQAWPTPPALQAMLDSRSNREADWYLGDTTDYVGKRTEDATNTTYNLLAGFDGTFENNDWTWEFYVSHGATNLGATFGGFLSVERYRYLLYQPNYGRGASAIGNAYGGRVAGVLNCTTGLPIMQNFTPSQDCIDGVQADLQNQSKMEQNVAEFNLQGKMASLPAGDARFALGADYRWNSYKYNTDILQSQQSFIDGVIGFFPASNAAGETSVKELYGELLLPLVSGKKAAKEFSLELGYRTSDNNPSGSVDTYKGLFNWAPTDKVRFRGGHQVANRAPNIGELFLAKTQTVVFNVFGDPCSEFNFVAPSISANPSNPNAAQVKAICQLQMGPAGTAAYYAPNGQAGGGPGLALANTIGNPLLHSETADTNTFGVVLQLKDRTTLSVDYWDINISDLISAQSVGAVMTQCFSAAFNPTFSANAPACLRLTRDTQTGQFNAADVTYSNEAAVETSGVDVQFNWGTNLGKGNIALNFLASYLDSVKTQLSPGTPFVEYKGTFGPTLPSLNGGAFDYRTFTTLSYFNGNWNLSLRWTHLPSIQSAAAATGPTSTLPTNSYDKFDLTGGVDFGQRWNFRYGIDNLLNRQPEVTDATPWSAGQATNGNFYDVLGRSVYVGMSLKF